MKMKNLPLGLLCFFLISFSQLFGSSGESEQGMSLIQVKTDLDDSGVLHLCVTGPSHLAINEAFNFHQTASEIRIESDFILTEYPSKNPQTIHFLIFAQNTIEGIELTISEMQVFKIEGWFSDSLSTKEASQSILIENSFLDIDGPPELRIAKNIFKNSGIFRFKLLKD